MCTQEYNPVIGILKDGTQKVYSNICTACSNPDVIGYLKKSME